MHPHFLTPTTLTATGRNPAALRRSATSGDLVRVRRGLYLPGSDWQSLSSRRKHLARVRAQLRSVTGEVVVSHASAGAAWNLPVLDQRPDRVHLIDLRRTTSKTTSTVFRHPSALPVEVVLVDGIPCTPLARTVIDVGLSEGFLSAVLVSDYVLARGLATLAELRHELGLHTRARNAAQVRAALEITHPGSHSAGESISKGQIHLLGFEPPELQKAFRCPGGATYYVDFWWPCCGCIGEFDGEEKYRSPDMRGTKSVEDVLLKEKARTDSLIALPEVHNLVRWNYATARNATALAEVLTRAGVPLR